MVIKKDPRAILDMLSKPVEVDDDEFLDKLDPNKSFALMPDHPAEDVAATVARHAHEQEVLEGLADVTVDEEDLGNAAAPSNTAPVELTTKERTFFSLFKGRSAHEEVQAAVSDNVDMAKVKAPGEAAALPRVGDTAGEKEAKEEDLARRAAYIAANAKTEAEHAKTKAYNESHDRYVAVFKDVKDKK